MRHLYLDDKVLKIIDLMNRILAIIPCRTHFSRQIWVRLYAASIFNHRMTDNLQVVGIMNEELCSITQPAHLSSSPGGMPGIIERPLRLHSTININ